MTTQESIRFPRDHLAPDPGKGKASRKIPSRRGMVDRNDEFIMGTNNSSIVSKRSVERLYFPNEPHFYRYFVKKPLRRSPLINRGYWIRMKAIDSVVHQFLGQRSSKQKIVINLGCASDPLPWQCLTRYANACQDVKFIDVDYVDLMLNKRDVVQRTRELNSMLTNLEISDGDVLLSSDQYLQLGCDLRDLPRLEQALARAIKLSECIILFIAEVSITYMNTEAADALIRWAATLPQARFCLLEQIIPAGQDHPFAQTMMAHFNKLQTPLRPMLNYPTSYAQEQRFRALGWNQASACNLWKLWSSSDFIGPAERQALDRIEPFDEWEELALFGCHYFLLTANNTHFQELSYVGLHNFKESSNLIQSPNFEVNPRAEAFFVAYPKQQGYRRFSAVLRIRGRDQENDLIGNFAGMGLNTRVNSYDLYSTEGQGSVPYYIRSQVGPQPRMCHTITDLGDVGALLVGGRNSPDNALTDCWLYHKWLNTWERVDDLPYPLYRHSAFSLSNGSVLVTTGRCSSQNVTGEFLVWSRRLRWVKCTYTSSERPCATYGATFAVFPSDFSQDQPHSNRGLLAGGISEDGLLQKGVWIWELQDCSSKEPKLAFRLCSDSLAGEDKSTPIARFGAVALIHNDRIHIVGGIARDDILDAADEICVFDPKVMATQAIPWTNQNISSPRPLFIGTSVTTTEKSLVIMGGSAVCFSFGTFWNKGCFTIDIKDHLDSGSPNPTTPWFYIHTIDAAVPKLSPSGHSKTPRDQNLVIIPRIRVKDSTEFTHIVKATTPAIIEGADLGPCTKAWTIDYLKESVGAEREVIVHVASTDHMDFTAKNFSYASQKFGEFLDGANSGAKFYLRSLSAEKPSELPADIKKDYPSIADDFRLPPEMEFIAEHAHSTPLRIAGPVTMWLHYDVMANILCQIRGSKRLLLFPPSDVTNFNFAPGASSSSFNVFEKFGGSELENTQPHEALLEPGDILFIPSLWLHTASPTSGLSVAVNIFFRNLQEGYATGRDVYGNRDLAAYEKGRQDLNKIIKLFDGLPADVRAFYMQRLVDELQQKLEEDIIKVDYRVYTLSSNFAMTSPTQNEEESVQETPKDSVTTSRMEEESLQPQQPETKEPIETIITEYQELEQWNSSRTNRYRYFATLYSFTVMGMNDAVSGALIPYLETYYHVNYTIISLLFLGPFVGYTVVALLNNQIHMRFGQRGVAIIAPTCHLLSYIITAIHPPYPVLPFIFVLSGFGQGLMDGGWNAWVGNMQNANELMGILHGAYGLGATISPLIATAMVTRGKILPWYSFYYVMIGMSFLELVICVFAFWLETGAKHRAKHSILPSQEGHSRTKEALLNPITWLCAIFLLCYVGAEVSLAGWLPSFMLVVRHGGSFASGLVVTGFWLGQTFGRVTLGFVTGKLGEKIAIAGYLITCMVLELCFWLIPSFVSSAIFAGFLGYFMGPIFPAGIIVATKLLPRRLHVIAVGFAAAFGGGGAAIFPFAVGAIAEAKGVKVLQPIVLALLAALLTIWCLLPGGFKKQGLEAIQKRREEGVSGRCEEGGGTGEEKRVDLDKLRKRLGIAA